MELDRRDIEEENLRAEEIALQMNERYGRRRGQISQVDTGIPAQFIAGVNQPNLFVIRCKQGKEKDVVLQFMRRFKESEYSQHPIEILSATCRDALKGYVYVEAWKLAHVQKAILNMNNLFNSQIKLVPLAERDHVLTIRKKDISLKEGSWAKVRKGKYAGDLVQISWVYGENPNEVRIRCVPRIEESENDSNKRKKKTTVKDFDNGYIERDIKVTNLVFENVSPTMDEITEYLSAADSNCTYFASRSSDAPIALPTKVIFTPGDEVEVIGGSDRGVYGIVEAVNKEYVTFTRYKSGVPQQVTFLAEHLAKRFSIGDHVQVLNGSHKGETGMIVNIDSVRNHVTLWSDLTKSEIKVFSKDLKKITESTGVRSSGSDYEVQDLVQTSAGQVGVIVNVDRSKYTILETDGNISTYTRDEIIKKEDTRRFTSALGQNQIMIKVGDIVTDVSAETVTITKGPYKGYLGIVKDTTPVMARVELHTNCSIVNVEKTKLLNVDTSRPVVLSEPITNRNTREYSPAPSNYSGSSWQSSNVRTPNSWNGSRTPTWNNPMSNQITSDGSRTPSHADGSRTPAVHLNDGSRTPAWDLGSKTPAYAGSDGSRTPAWDTGSRTPAYVAENRGRTSTWEANYPATPATENQSFTAPTPGAETPACTAPTPGASETPLYAMATPGNTSNIMIPATPGPGPMTPANLLPQTPFVSASTIPTGGDFRNVRQEVNSNSKEWLTVDIQIRIVPDQRGVSFNKGQYDNRMGVINRLESPTTCLVNLDDSQEQCFIEQKFLEPVQPQKKEKIKMIAGDLKGQLGILVGVDGVDGVVKVKGGKDFKIVNMSMMAKYVGEEVAEE
ncbi:11955_t:CDS:10 [Acaulospora colombiana]|uniref:11955_t:CDS:1 n=1 Tax=Acaulospora colombiana TaxID=27376 RepID=A0ACA9LD94_9GLOM|nr:11955_t:CDS:10 [Acaulospora colombiana]